jgi:NADH:ubiquinone oxidoreductase subunit 2 (subunit N)
MWTAALWIAGFFIILMAICMAIYIAVVRAFYWGDKKEPPKKKKD